MQNIYQVNISNEDDLIKICQKIDTDSRALLFLKPKHKIFYFYAENVDFRAASFLKQEMLSRGGETIVTKHVIDAKIDFSDVLIMGTKSQIKSLLLKLKTMDCWGLKNIRDELEKIFNNIFVNNWKLSLPENRELILNNDTKLMAIINLTPDSFFEASRFHEKEIINVAENFLNAGADILDLGGESTRPGATQISESEELNRILPAIKILRKEFPNVIISVDTYKSNVAEVAASEGIDIINDISGFNFDNKMPDCIAKFNVGYVLSHIRGTLQEMKNPKPYENLLGEINTYFHEKLKILESAGVKKENIIIDPGLGFAKSQNDNLVILKNISSLKNFGLPILIGHSRKKFTENDLFTTIALSAYLYGKVQILRIHDVLENYHAIKIIKSLNKS